MELVVSAGIWWYLAGSGQGRLLQLLCESWEGHQWEREKSNREERAQILNVQRK